MAQRMLLKRKFLIPVFSGILFFLSGWQTASALDPSKPSANQTSMTASGPDLHDVDGKSPRDLFSDTWVATDALGRTLPVGGEVRSPVPGKQVGIFYFTWHGAHGYGGPDPKRDDMGVVFKDYAHYESPHNLSEIFAADPENPQLGAVHEFHHWGEPELGYYVADDPYVIRRHAEMLVDAGIDFLFIDATNGYTYAGVYTVIFSEFEKLQSEGRKVPKFAFITHDHCDYKNVVSSLYEDIYKLGRFRNLWFEWQGKPLILAPSKGLPEEILTAFTWRQSWAWTNPVGWFEDGKDKWPWLDHTPQNFGWHESPDVPEQITVTVAQHATSNIGRSHQGGVQPPRDQAQPGLGLYFEEQWRRAHEVDPPVTMITGWNEWVAQYFQTDGVKDVMFGQLQPEGSPRFVDAYDEEYNRDIEPMRGGSTDNLYYQMVAHLRRLKGARPIPPAGPPEPIIVDGDAQDWKKVTPEYRDHAFDTTHRNHMGWGRIDAYTNTLGRNDIVTARIARSDGNLYFLAETREPITSSSDKNWMLLFIDADRNPATGWEGFDYVVNLDVPAAGKTTVKKAVLGEDGETSWQTVAEVPFAVQGRFLEIAIPYGVLGWTGETDGGFDFKWVDNPEHLQDITGFFQAGDAAPSRRFKYRYAIKP
jgi:hypothetical protein